MEEIKEVRIIKTVYNKKIIIIKIKYSVENKMYSNSRTNSGTVLIQ